MFTGLVETLGTVREITPMGEAVRFLIEPAVTWHDVALGDSIAINGVCLTVVPQETLSSAFGFDLGPETLNVSSLSQVTVGAQVHLERALQVGSRLGGHMVQGHVDGVGLLQTQTWVGETLKLRFSAPPEVLRYCIHKGSIAIDGVSLTINTLHDDGFEVWLIPHTLEKTRLHKIEIGEKVNLEADLIGKYVERLLNPSAVETTSNITWSSLSAFGQQKP